MIKIFTTQELDEYLAEADSMNTAELITKEELTQDDFNKNKLMLCTLLSDTALKETYGNKTIKRDREIAPLLKKIPTGCDKNIIELTIGAYGCTYQQAITKMCIAFNINYDHDTWFKKQWLILQHNLALLENPIAIASKHHKLWLKIKESAHMRKYFRFLLELFQTQLEHYGISYKGYSKPLIASASFKFATKSIRNTVKITDGHIKTTKQNMASITRFGMTKKLSDSQVEKLDPDRFARIKALTKGWRTTITSYEMILWDDQLLELVELTLDENKTKKIVHQGQNKTMFESVGSSDVFSKSNATLTKEDRDNINSLLKWARVKVYDKKSCGFFTEEEWQSRFNNSDKDNTIWVSQKKMNVYRTIVLQRLDLESVQATKKLKSLMKNNKKLQAVDYHKYVYLPAEITKNLK